MCIVGGDCRVYCGRRLSGVLWAEISGCIVGGDCRVYCGRRLPGVLWAEIAGCIVGGVNAEEQRFFCAESFSV